MLTRESRPVGRQSETAAKQSQAIVDRDADTFDDRPRCAVVGVYCEALGWLSREPRSRATVCCRHYWAEAEVAV